jgi:hypothetical protein
MTRKLRLFTERKIVRSELKWILSLLAVGFAYLVISFRVDSAGQPDSANKIDSLAATRKNSSSKPDSFVIAEKSKVTKPFGRTVTNNAFSVGENLEFRVRYGVVVAGSSRMGVDDTVRINGNLCYKIVTEAYSSKFFSTFFKVEDQVVSYADKAGLFSWFFEQHLREGRYKADRWAQYNQRENLVYTHKKDTLKVPPYVNDILSSFYFVRTQNLVVGDTLYIQNHANKKIYPMAIIVHGKENIEVKAGKFRCVIVEPVVTEGGLFKHEGKLTIWFSDDEKKIPVQMKSKVSFLGSITAELSDIKGVDKKKLARW